MAKKKIGRGKGAKTKNRFHGVFKKCPCKKKTQCSHSRWYGSYQRKDLNGGKPYRFCINTDPLVNQPELSLIEAQRAYHLIVDEILKGKWPRRRNASTPVTTDTNPTFDDLAPLYVADFAKQTWRGKPRRPHRAAMLEKQLALICRTTIQIAKGVTVRVGDLRCADFKRAHIEGFRDSHRAHMQEQAKIGGSPERPKAQNGEVGLNRHLEVIRAWINWAIKKEYFQRENPFKLHGVAIVELTEENDRDRRLLPDEEEKLLAAASPHMQAMIIAAIESGMRRGEVLGLQWMDIKHAEHGKFYIDLPYTKTKTSEPRQIPISPRLACVLAQRRHDADGVPFSGKAFVFGTITGEAIAGTKMAWKGTCERAKIEDLHFHDLRREAGSRWLEAGVNLRTVSQMLGHKKISTTDIYLKPSRAVDDRAMREFFQSPQARRAEQERAAEGQRVRREPSSRPSEARVH